tara:strand:- start:33 stop:158 length:126 start_codon:yes stop_codon:yes gene_type:complete
MTDDGAEFVALELIKNWGRKEPMGMASPILDPDVTEIGVSF